MTDNHRIITDGNDWMRDKERRMKALERRRGVPSIEERLGHGIAPKARHVVDWNDPSLLANGWYYSDILTVNTPDPMRPWVGQVVITYTGQGIMQAWSSDAAAVDEYTRQFTYDGVNLPTFTPWRHTTGISAIVGPATNGSGTTGDTYCIRSGHTVNTRIWIARATAPANGAVLQTLPAGHAPVFDEYFSVVDFASGTNVQVLINTIGQVVWIAPGAWTGSALGARTYLSP